MDPMGLYLITHISVISRWYSRTTCSRVGTRCCSLKIIQDYLKDALERRCKGFERCLLHDIHVEVETRCICIYTYTSIIYIHTFTDTDIYIHTYIQTYLPTCIHTYLHTYLHTYINTYMITCV